MGTERRTSERITKMLPTILYFKTDNYKDNVEVDATILNISEGGIAFEVETTDFVKTKIFNDAQFAFLVVDEYEYLQHNKNVVLYGNCTVRWFVEKDDKIQMGCQIVRFEDKWHEYVMEQKVNSFLKHLENSRKRHRNG